AYTMTVRDMNNGCTSQTTALLGDNRVFPVITTTNTVPLDCGNLATVKLMAQVVGMNPNQVTAQWYGPDPTPGIQNPNTLTLTTDGVGDYKLVVTTNSNGCTSSAVVKVTNGVLTANFTADQESGFAPLTVNFTNNSASSSNSTPTQSITSIWSFGNGTTRTTTVNTTQAGTSAVYTQPGTYTVTMYATKGSCIDTFVKVIRVDIPSKLEVPNVFTPNGDGANDIFFVRTANLSEISAVIFDRWGNKIYELTTEKGNIAWDGKSNTGKEAPDGTYFYIITAKGKDGQNYETKGTLSLFR
ncbi:MAG: gliding motility-associated C-terminal domain-containing protein, partial [Bacteroidota bacterium]